MKRQLLMMIAGFTVAATGCVSLQPIGPFANQLGGRPAPEAPSNAVRVAEKPGLPVLPPAPPPLPPAILVTPGEVGELSPQQAIQKLDAEMKADRQAMERMPRYAEVSRPGR